MSYSSFCRRIQSGEPSRYVLPKPEFLRKEKDDEGFTNIIVGKKCNMMPSFFRRTQSKEPIECLPPEPKLLGRDEEIESLIGIVLTRGITVIPVVGMQGLGKTTLVRSVYDSEEVKRHFSLKTWVFVLNEMNIPDIMRQILETVPHRGSTADKSMRWVDAKLEEDLSYSPFLVVLDDFWNIDYNRLHNLLSQLRNLSPLCKVILTTRNQNVADVLTMRYVKCMALSFLSDQHCLSLLCAYAGLDQGDGSFSTFEDIAKKIAEKCSGLPLAAKCVGGLLRTKETVEDWKEILSSQCWVIKDNSIDIMSVLRMCYDDLSPPLQMCFSFFGLFPEDFRLSENEIIFLWIGAGVFQSVKNGSEKEKEARKCFQELFSRALICSEGSQFVFHSTVQDLAREVSGNRYINDVKMDISLESTRCVFFNILICKQVCERLKNINGLPIRIFKAVSKLKFYAEDLSWGDIPFGQMIFLKHLDLSYTHDKGKSLKSVTSLYNLDTLILSRSHLNKLPERIGKLINLWYLDLRSTNLKSLPESIGNLKRLHYLDLSDSWSLTSLPDSIGNLEELGNLVLRGCSALKCLPESVCNLKLLSNLNLGNCRSLESLPESFGNLMELCNLDLSHCSLTSLPESIGNAKKLCSLDLENCCSLKSLPESIGNLKDLYYLNLHSCRTLRLIPECIGNLANLYLLDADDCRQIKHMPVRIQECTKLECLPIYRIGGSEGLLSFENLRNLRGFLEIYNLNIATVPRDAILIDEELEKLRLYWNTQSEIAKEYERLQRKAWQNLGQNWNMENEIVEEFEPNDEKKMECEMLFKQLEPHKNLKKLVIDNSYMGCGLPQWLLNGSLKNLTYLELRGCRNRNTLLTLHAMPLLKRLWVSGSPEIAVSLSNLPALTRLDIMECRILECVNPFSLELVVSLHVSVCMERMSPLFIEKVKQGWLQASILDIGSQCRDFIGHTRWTLSNIHLIPEQFNEEMVVQLLYLGEQHALEYLPQSISNAKLLRKLIISNCHSLKKLFPSGAFPPALEELAIINCKGLTTVSISNANSIKIIEMSDCECVQTLSFQDHLPNGLEVLRISTCPELKIRLQTGVVQDKLQTLKIGMHFHRLPDLLPDLNSISLLKIEGCTPDVLKSILKLHLPSLRLLSLHSCDGVTSFPPEEMKHELILLTQSLRELWLSFFPDLKRLSSSRALGKVSFLCLQMCHKLKSFPDKGLPCSIKELVINDCPLLEKKLNDCDVKFGLKISHIPYIELNGKRFHSEEQWEE